MLLDLIFIHISVVNQVNFSIFDNTIKPLYSERQRERSKRVHYRRGLIE